MGCEMHSKGAGSRGAAIKEQLLYYCDFSRTASSGPGGNPVSSLVYKLIRVFWRIANPQIEPSIARSAATCRKLFKIDTVVICNTRCKRHTYNDFILDFRLYLDEVQMPEVRPEMDR